MKHKTTNMVHAMKKPRQRKKPTEDGAKKHPIAPPLLVLRKELSGPVGQPMREFTAVVSAHINLTLHIEAVDEAEAQTVAENARGNFEDSIPMWLLAREMLDRDLQILDVTCHEWDASGIEVESPYQPRSVTASSCMVKPGDQPLMFFGSDSHTGSYLLRINVKERLNLVFGSGIDAKAIPFERGEYLYLGSATSKNGANSLAGQLVRHTTRIGDGDPHLILKAMEAQFPTVGLANGESLLVKPKQAQSVVDHLLEQPTVTLERVYVIRGPSNLGVRLAEQLGQYEGTHVFVNWHGVNEYINRPNLLRVLGGEAWWKRLPSIISDVLNEKDE